MASPSATKVDPAIIAALSLDPTVTTISPHGGSDFSLTAKVTTIASQGKGEPTEVLYFVKMMGETDAEVMFSGEHASLNAIHAIVPSLCPRSHAHGLLKYRSGFFLATDFLDLNSSAPLGQKAVSLAVKLAKLHTTPAPTPAGYEAPQFGFSVPTCCGSTVQPNDYCDSWPEFFAKRRLGAILAVCERQRGPDIEFSRLGEKVAAVVVPRLLGKEHLKTNGKTIVPVVVHGDLWAGNHGLGSIGRGPVEEVVFDPSSCHAHSEYELGIMRMFGGYGDTFFTAYHKLKPKDEPTEEYGERMDLYELYHYLNHYAIFGGGYRSSAVSIMKKLDNKYGNMNL